MRLSLIGMSGAGKTHWSRLLANDGYRRYPCDELIEKRLGEALRRPDGEMATLGEWMGLPYQPSYADHERRYLECEAQILDEILDEIESLDANQDLVVDTTGSVVYLSPRALERLRATTKIVYLTTPDRVLNQMFAAFRQNVRPVVWHGHFHPIPGETDQDSVAHCFPELMRERDALYTKWADVRLEYDEHRRDASAKEFLDLIEPS